MGAKAVHELLPKDKGYMFVELFFGGLHLYNSVARLIELY